MARRVQLTIDRFRPYLTALEHASGSIIGHPDIGLISTSYVERQNLTFRMQGEVAPVRWRVNPWSNYLFSPPSL